VRPPRPRPNCSGSSRPALQGRFLKAKTQLATIASYDQMPMKDVKLPTLSDRPTSSVVRTID